jgi:hypothetical protein
VQLDMLPTLCLSADDQMTLRSYVSGGGDPAALKDGERFVCGLLEVPRLKNKVRGGKRRGMMMMMMMMMMMRRRRRRRRRT